MDSDGTFSDDFKDQLQSDGFGVPTGSIVFWPLDTVPSGWLSCNGQVVSRTAYEGLFAVYGIRYGAGDGSTTFQLPNLSGKFLMGASASHALGSTGGSETVELDVANLPPHKPELQGSYKLFVRTGSSSNNDVSGTTGAWEHLSADDAFEDVGDGTPVNILNPFFAGAWICKA